MNKRQALPEIIRNIANDIDRMPPEPSTAAELLLWMERIYAFVDDAQDNGLTYEEIAEEFRKMGYPIKLKTGRSAAGGASPSSPEILTEASFRQRCACTDSISQLQGTRSA